MSLSFEEVLAEELRELERLRVRRGVRAETDPDRHRQEDSDCQRPERRSKDEATSQPGAAAAPADSRTAVEPAPMQPTVTARAHFQRLVGLAFSGGGIRSATFNLGILQTLAKLGLLPHIDYLSTVSGGGYIGSWLLAWIKRQRLEKVAEGLEREHSKNPNKEQVERLAWRDREPKGSVTPITFLRRYGNYLTPHTGFLSLDSWMAMATYARNLILNLNLLILALACALLLPRLFVAAVLAAKPAAWWNAPESLELLVVALALLLAWAMAAMFEASARPPRLARRPGASASEERVLLTVVLPVFLIALLLVHLLFGEPGAIRGWLDGGGYWSWGFAGGYALLGFWVAFATFVIAHLGIREGLKSLRLWPGSAAFWAGVGPPLATFLAGAGLGWLLRLVTGATALQAWEPVHRLHLAVWGPPATVLALAVAGVYFVGLMGRALPEQERQWWSRVGGFLAILSAGWLTLFAISFYAPPALRWAASQTPALIGAVGLGWLLSTALGVVAGRSPATGGNGSNRWLEIGVTVAPYVFVLGLLMLLSLGIDALLPRLLRIEPAVDTDLATTAGWLGDSLPGLCVCLVVIAALTTLLSWRIDINEFSMHNFYRDRLTRAYLGASHDRTPNPFTGFDPGDDLDLTELLNDDYDGPYPILNAALNLTSGKTELAWQERKASSFVFTPLHHGFERRRPGTATVPTGGYRTSKDLTRGTDRCRMSLGTALTVSGAAVNPSMGYHSSPALSFLLTVFNARLGLWMGNPAHPDSWRAKSPTWSLGALFSELLGQTGAESKWVNLADGGFFDNLGVYELVRRRCRFILACDAESDPGLEFSGLGNLIRRCRSDLGIEIRFESLEPLERRGGGPFSHWHCAVGTIQYNLVDAKAPDGTLVYIKSTLTGDEPTDVLNYQRKHDGFPHESTADQWFDESQFESYRSLGEHIGEVVFRAVGLRPRR